MIYGCGRWYNNLGSPFSGIRHGFILHGVEVAESDGLSHGAAGLDAVDGKDLSEGGNNMNIALIAHDSKKELMVQFCIAYCGIFSRHTLCATGTTGKMVSEATGLHVQRFLGGAQGGDQQIAARIACNEIDLLLFFRDPIRARPGEPDEAGLLRLCDVHNIPVATNIATAEALIHSLERGDLDWRNIVNPKKI